MECVTRSDLSYIALELAKKNNSVTIAYFRKVDKVIEEMKRKKNRVYNRKISSMEDLQIIGVVDVSYKNDEKSVGGMILTFPGKELKIASPIIWKFKQIEKVCYSLKDVETLAISRIVDEKTYKVRQIEINR